MNGNCGSICPIVVTKKTEHKISRNYSLCLRLSLTYQIMSLYLFAQIWIICLVNPSCKGFESSELNVGCQHKSTSGRDYRGAANTTSSGVPCQKWSDTQALDHPLTTILQEHYWNSFWPSLVPNQHWTTVLFISILPKS